MTQDTRHRPGSDPAPRTDSVEAAWTPAQFRGHVVEEARSLAKNPAPTSANEHNRKRSVREYTLGEEIANSVTHGLGALLSVAALPILIVASVLDGGGVKLAAALIYGISMLLEYTMSTLYHAIAADRAKRVFKILDHSFIYIFIAGTYTPFCLVTLADSGGLVLCGVVWALALLGVALESFWVFRPRWLAGILYLALGWCVVAFAPALAANLDPVGLVLLVTGGVCYSVGVIFYVLKKVPYMHSIFHLWVLAGSAFQFFAILLYVL